MKTICKILFLILFLSNSAFAEESSDQNQKDLIPQGNPTTVDLDNLEAQHMDGPQPGAVRTNTSDSGLVPWAEAVKQWNGPGENVQQITDSSPAATTVTIHFLNAGTKVATQVYQYSGNDVANAYKEKEIRYDLDGRVEMETDYRPDGTKKFEVYYPSGEDPIVTSFNGDGTPIDDNIAALAPSTVKSAPSDSSQAGAARPAPLIASQAGSAKPDPKPPAPPVKQVWNLPDGSYVIIYLDKMGDPIIRETYSAANVLVKKEEVKLLGNELSDIFSTWVVSIPGQQSFFFSPDGIKIFILPDGTFASSDGTPVDRFGRLTTPSSTILG